MSLQSKVIHAFLNTPLGRQVEKILRQAKIALTVLIVTLVMAFFCLLIVSAYVLMLLLRGA